MKLGEEIIIRITEVIDKRISVRDKKSIYKISEKIIKFLEDINRRGNKINDIIIVVEGRNLLNERRNKGKMIFVKN